MERSKLGDFTWVDLAARDLEAQTAFYEAMFGWEHTDMPTDQGPIYRMFTLDGSVVAGASQMSPDMLSWGIPTMWNTYIASPDLDAITARAVDLGGEIVMPAMTVMDQGRMVGIKDPTGGTFFFWQAAKHNGAEKFSEPGTLIWSELDTRDPEKAAAYFTELLGWDVQSSGGEPPYWMINVGGQPQGGIMMMPGQLPAEVPPYWLVYFGATDVAATVAKARSLGATVNMEPMDAGGMLFGVISDPAGAVFAVMTPMMP